MLFKEIISLLSVTIIENSMGDPIGSVTEREVFADKQSIRQSEFYQAAATGLRPELMFVIRSIEYNNEPTLRYNSKDYDIIRTYEKDEEMLELICQGITNGVM